MKKFVAFVMILSFGLLVAIGCGRPNPPAPPPKVPATVVQPAQPGTEKPAATHAEKSKQKPGEKPAAKPAEKK